MTGLEVGKQKTTVMVAIHAQAASAIGRERTPRLKGPFMVTKFLCQTTPIRIGSPYEIYRPIVAIEVAAANATDEPSDGNARMKDNVAASQTVRIGERKRASTLWKK